MRAAADEDAVDVGAAEIVAQQLQRPQQVLYAVLPADLAEVDEQVLPAVAPGWIRRVDAQAAQIGNSVNGLARRRGAAGRIIGSGKGRTAT